MGTHINVITHIPCSVAPQDYIFTSLSNIFTKNVSGVKVIPDTCELNYISTFSMIIFSTKWRLIDIFTTLWSCLYCYQTLLNYFPFQSFDVERTWWRLFQKRLVRTKFDIYVFAHLMLNNYLDHVYFVMNIHEIYFSLDVKKSIGYVLLVVVFFLLQS